MPVLLRGFFARWLSALVLLVAATQFFSSAAQAADALKGVALVVGNGDYAHLPKLANPVNDATAIKGMLDSLGFETTLADDRDLAALRRDLDDFAGKAKTADVAVVYYAGHGIEAGGENFLVPVDADLSALGAASDRLLPLSPLLDRLKTTVPIAIVILDACRNNPFPPDAKVHVAAGSEPVPIGTAGLGETRGAAPLPPADGKPPETENLGTVIAFSAEPGKPALDGDPTGNSPYAAAVLRHLSAMDGAEFGLVMRMIAEEVYLKTSGRQRPWVNESLRRLLYFGRAPAEPSGIEGDMLGERRRLLVSIDGLDSFGRGEVERVADQEGVKLDAVFAMAGVLGKTGPKDPQESEKLLREGAERLKEYQSEPLPSGLDAELDRLTALAADAMAEGLFDSAAAVNEQAKARARDLAKGFSPKTPEGKKGRAALALVFARAGETHELAFLFDKATADFEEAAALADGADDKLAADIRFRQVRTLVSLGTFVGDNAALQGAADKAAALAKTLPARKSELLTLRAFALLTLASRSGDKAQLDQAVSVYKAAVDAAPKAKDPARWASAMNGLGLALTDLAERDADGKRYHEAIDAFGKALEETPRQDHPVEWAETTANLGNALQGLGVLEDGTESLARSVDAYEAALEVRTRQRSPVDWAGLQNNLGAALSLLGAREDGTEHLTQSVAAHRAALEVFTRERLPSAWAGTMYNLAAAELELGRKATGTAEIDEAAATWRAALEVQSRAADPLLWARTKAGLGGALLLSGSRGDGTAALADAATALQDALGVLDRDRHRLLWASVTGDLGWTQSILGARRGDRSLLRQAVASLKASLDAAGRDAGPERWATIEDVLGTTLFQLTVQTKVDTELTDAIAAFRAALEVRSPERNRRDWATSRNNLANALQLLAARKQSTDGLAEAVAAYRDALTEFTRERDARQWAIIEHNIGASLRALAEPGKDIGMLKQAAAALGEALTERSEARDGLDWALSTEELGRVLYLIGVWGNDTPSLEQSVGLLEGALKLLDAADNRDLWLDAQFRLGDALSILSDAKQDAGMMRRSADAFAAFVETATVDDSAYHWVVAANGRAWELIAAYRIDGDAARLPEAVDWARRAVKAATKANDAENAAYSADTLCEGLTELGTKEHDRGMAEEAVQACTWALGVMQTMKLDDVIAEAKTHLKRAEELLAELK